MNAARLDRLQNLAIFLLSLSAAVLFMSLPLFGPLSNSSLFELGRERLREETVAVEPRLTRTSSLAYPVRIAYTGGFACLGTDALTTLSDEFERAGIHLGEALGSANHPRRVGEKVFLDALRDEGLYIDFAVPVPVNLLCGLLGVDPPETELAGVRRLLLSPGRDGYTMLYVQDGAGGLFRFSTAASGAALLDFLTLQSGSSAEFAFMRQDCAGLSPFTLILNDPFPRMALQVTNAVSGSEDEFLRLAEFNAHAENRFTESTGTVIVREGSSTLYIRPDGTVEYQGTEAAPDSIYYVPAATPGEATLEEAEAAAQRLASDLLQSLSGDASYYLSDAETEDGKHRISFDLMVNGTPVCFSDGAHAGEVTVEAQRITAFSFRARRYELTGQETMLLPFAQASAIAKAWEGSEPLIVYIDSGGELVLPSWIAD